MQSVSARGAAPAASRCKGNFHSPAPRCGETPVSAAKHSVLLTPVLGNRRLTAVLALTAALQIGLAAGGLSVWSCPFQSAFSIPCPACGMTSGAILLLQGQWALAVRMHLFSPLLIAGTMAAGLLALMPAPAYRRIICQLEVLERRTGLTVWIAVCLGASWIWRMVGGI